MKLLVPRVVRAFVLWEPIDGLGYIIFAEDRIWRFGFELVSGFVLCRP